MDIHNITEDRVLALVYEICEAIEQSGNSDKLCTCGQCRLDTACYVLNRLDPHYVVSSRGVARVDLEALSRQQTEADIATKIHEGLKRINSIQRPNFNHETEKSQKGGLPTAADNQKPVFNIPTIIGKVYNGIDFSPILEGSIELRRNGELVTMRDPNWQNPYTLVQNTSGAFTFWPAPIFTDNEGVRESFSYSITIRVSGFEEHRHFFNIPVLSEPQTAGSFSIKRSFTLPDIYIFYPGKEQDHYLVDIDN